MILILFFCVMDQVTSTKVNLKNQGLTEIPFEEITTDVENLDLSGNELTSLDANIFTNHMNIEVLSFSINQIANVSSQAFNGILGLQELNFNKNLLSEMPNLSFHSNSLVDLNLKNNDIVPYAGSTIVMNELKKLNLENNKLTSLSVNALRYEMPKLTWLSIKNNKLASISSGTFGAMTSLKKLYLSKNFLTEFNPETLSISGTLTVLKIDQNKLVSFDDTSFSDLQNVIKLELTNNKITEFDIDTLTCNQGLTNLINLHLHKNELTAMPGISPSTVGLKILNLAENQISTVDQNFFDNLTQLKSLYLNGQSLTEMPTFQYAMDSLETLDLSQNLISTIGDNYFANTKNLKTLLLHKNNLVNITILTSLTQIEEINLADNLLQAFPKLGSAITILQELYLSNNDILELTLESIYGTGNPVMNASALTTLSLDGNARLAPTPIEVWHSMPNLVNLDLGNSEVNEFPDLSGCARLTDVGLNDNHLVSMGNTAYLIKNTELGTLDLQNNNFATIENLLEITDSLSSTTLTVRLQGNDLLCDASMCWMKYLSLR